MQIHNRFQRMEYLRKKVNSHLHANFPQGCRLLSLSTLFRSRSHCNAQLKKSEMRRRKKSILSHETKILSSCSRFARKRIKCPKEENFSSRKKGWLSTRLERISFDRLELAAEISLKPNNFTIVSIFFHAYLITRRTKRLFSRSRSLSLRSVRPLCSFNFATLLFWILYRENEEADTIFPPRTFWKETWAFWKKKKFHGIGLSFPLSASFVHRWTSRRRPAASLEKKEKRENRIERTFPSPLLQLLKASATWKNVVVYILGFHRTCRTRIYSSIQRILFPSSR